MAKLTTLLSSYSGTVLGCHDSPAEAATFLQVRHHGVCSCHQPGLTRVFAELPGVRAYPQAAEMRAAELQQTAVAALQRLLDSVAAIRTYVECHKQGDADTAVCYLVQGFRRSA